MKKSELRNIIRPMVEEIVYSLLQDEEFLNEMITSSITKSDLLSHIISESIKGSMGATSVVVESQKPKPANFVPQNTENKKSNKFNFDKSKIFGKEYEKPSYSLDISAVTGLPPEIFENTKPLNEQGIPGKAPTNDDPGIDITKLPWFK